MIDTSNVTTERDLEECGREEPEIFATVRNLPPQHRSQNKLQRCKVAFGKSLQPISHAVLEALPIYVEAYGLRSIDVPKRHQFHPRYMPPTAKPKGPRCGVKGSCEIQCDQLFQPTAFTRVASIADDHR